MVFGPLCFSKARSCSGRFVASLLPWKPRRAVCESCRHPAQEGFRSGRECHRSQHQERTAVSSPTTISVAQSRSYFLGSGCPPCRTLVADLNQNPDEVYARLFIILSDESEFIDLGLIEAAPVVYQRDGAMARAFQTTATPHAFLVDHDCTIIASGTPNSIAGLRRLNRHGVKGGDHTPPLPGEVHVQTR